VRECGGRGADACGRARQPRFEAAAEPVDPALVRSGPRVGVSGAGGDGTAFPWRFWLDGEPTVSAYRPGVVRRRSRPTGTGR
jgi:DNA-3-methyladenine glycosylase